MENILDTLKSLPKELVLWIVYKLMQDEKITFADIVQAHVEHLEELRKGQSEHYQQLVSRIIEMHVNGKTKLKSSMREILHYLRDNGEINLTHEEIGKKYEK